MEIAITAFLHVDNGLHVARLHLHDDGDTHQCVNLAEFIQQSLFCYVLHVDVERGDDVAAVNGWRGGD